MELFANVKNAKGEIVEITSKEFSTKKDFKSYLHSEGFKVRFIAKDTVTDITQSYEKYEEKKATAKAKRKAKTGQVVKAIDYTLMTDNELHDVVFSQLDYINRDLIQTCVYNELNGNGKYVYVCDNDFMDVTPALAEYNRRFGTTEIFCLIYRHFESRKTHVEYDSFDDTMYIVEVNSYDEDNIIENAEPVGEPVNSSEPVGEPVGDIEKAEPVAEVENAEQVGDVENPEQVNQEVKIMPKFKAVVKKHNGVDIECMGFIAFDNDITKAAKKARKLFRQAYSGHYRKGDGYIEIFRQENGIYVYDTSCYL